MKGKMNDPNQEVEEWKDAAYAEYKNLHGKELSIYLRDRADQILKKHNIKCPKVRIKNKVVA